MADSETYPVEDDIEFRSEQAFIDVLEYDDTIAAIFGAPELVNIRRYKDKSKGARTLPAMAVESLVDQSIPRCNEYHCRMRIHCSTQADNDADGQMVNALLGAVRGALHADSTPDYAGHFEGDCNGFLEAANKASRGIVFHQIHEIDTDPDDDGGRSKKRILNVDAWCYPGRAEE